MFDALERTLDDDCGGDGGDGNAGEAAGAPAAASAAAQVRALMFVERFRDDIDRRLEALEA
jgi:hypothetical protein